ncbi:MAG: S41 family peptidase [Chloroflexi bacterium]|nr:S41 family peptidase [Chloroflexota bacterium]
MITKSILDRFHLVLLPALSLVMVLSLACTSQDEPAVEVVDENVVATSVVEPAEADEPPAEIETEDAPVAEEEPPAEVEVREPEPVEEASDSTSVFEQDPVPNIVEHAETTQLPDAVPDDVAVIWEAFQFINDEYVDYSLIDHGEMSEEAILGFIEALGDPHMTYITPDQMRMSRDDLAGAFFGIGATVAPAPDGKGVIIQAPMEGSPAMQAGIKPGDRILAVDGVDATSWSVSEAVLVIRGEEGVPVVLTILHVGDVDPVDIEIIRGRVKLESVKTRMIPDTSFAEMDIRQFTDETPGEIREHMNQMLTDGAEGVVIDLRNNPGGLLHATLDSASEFIPRGLLAYEQDRNGARRDFYASETGNFFNVPVVVLVNEWSGSGAELFAGAMQDHGRAVLIGVKTFGKGSVNITRTLSNGAGLNITIRRWYTPNGNVIEGVGLTPDVVVETEPVPGQRDVEWVEPQMDAAVKQLTYQTQVTTAVGP